MGIMDIASLFNAAPGEPGMFEQIKAAGEGFVEIGNDMKTLLAASERIEAQNMEILALLRKEGGIDDG